MTIRQEHPSDYPEVYNLVKMAFATNPDDDKSTPDYLNDLRTKPVFIPELSLVAQHENGAIIGQIVLYQTDITTPQGDKITQLVLSPISVHPAHFRKGIARKLVEDALETAKNMGYKAVFLCGHPPLYRKLGFTPTYEYNIFHIDDKEKTAQWCMVRELVPGALDNITGSVDCL